MLDEGADAYSLGREVFFSCIAELDVFSKYPMQVQIEADRLKTALSLFRPGAVSFSRLDIYEKPFHLFSVGGSNGPIRSVSLEYDLSQSDGPQLARFLETVTPVVPTRYSLPSQRPNSSFALWEPDFLSTAFDWYADALLAAKPLEGKIASAVACLEALFLGTSGSGELTYRLSRSAALLLGRYGWPSLEIKKQVTAAYAVRSTYVHGVPPSKGKKLTQETLVKMFTETAECARLACLVIVQW